MGFRKRRTYIIPVVLILLAIVALTTYRFFLSNNINSSGKEQVELLIPTGSNYQDVIALMQQKSLIKNIRSFKLLAGKMNYPDHIRPGRYLINTNTNNITLIRKLRAGKQDPVKLVLNNIDSRQELITLVSSKLECDPKELHTLLNDEQYLAKLGLNTENAWAVFISNTYEFYWNTSANQFIEKMLKEYDKFWKGTRSKKVQKLGLSPIETIILASIVQKESNKKDEYPLISGVYLNRLKSNWPLQADPTVKYALGNPGLKRILKAHLEFASPYNTYLNTGLPPGPICLPEIYAIDGVLNADQHGYMYFCAKDDFSGYHVFAKTLEEHNLNARRYQLALNKRNIY